MTNFSQSTAYRLQRSRCDLHHTYLCSNGVAVRMVKANVQAVRLEPGASSAGAGERSVFPA